MPTLCEAPALTSCRGCGGSPEILFEGRADATLGNYQIARFAYSTPFPVHRCPDCGLAWAMAGDDRDKVLDGYAEACDPVYLDDEPARRKTFRRGLNRLRRRCNGGRLLDVGAAVGLLLVEARDLGFDVHGIEPSRWAAAEAAHRFDLEVTVGDLESAPLPRASYDVVTMVDVIEHLIDPFHALHRVAELVRPGGLLHVVTPDLESIAAKLFGSRWWGFEPWHLWYFTRRSLEAALAEAGFDVIDWRGYRRTFSTGYWLRKLVGLAPFPFDPMYRLARATTVDRLPVTLDLRDTHDVIARRRGR